MSIYSKQVLVPKPDMDGYYALAYALQLIGRGTLDFDRAIVSILIEEWHITIRWHCLVRSFIVYHKGKRPTYFDPCNVDERNDMLVYIASLMKENNNE